MLVKKVECRFFSICSNSKGTSYKIKDAFCVKEGMRKYY